MKKLHRVVSKLGIMLMVTTLFVCASSAFAAEVVPVSYSWWPGTTAGGDDPGRTKLTDGIYGNTSPINFNDPQYVDWYAGYWPYILFDFGAVKTTNKIVVSSINYEAWGIAPVTNFQIQYSSDNVNWSQAFTFTHTPASPTAPAIEKSIANTGDHAARYVLLMSYHTRGGAAPWIFMDEVDFYDSTPEAVPEPASILALLSGIGGLSAAALRRRS